MAATRIKCFSYNTPPPPRLTATPPPLLHSPLPTPHHLSRFNPSHEPSTRLPLRNTPTPQTPFLSLSFPLSFLSIFPNPRLKLITVKPFLPFFSSFFFPFFLDGREVVGVGSNSVISSVHCVRFLSLSVSLPLDYDPAPTLPPLPPYPPPPPKPPSSRSPS